jgi:hypothetical protein
MNDCKQSFSILRDESAIFLFYYHLTIKYPALEFMYSDGIELGKNGYFLRGGHKK